MVVVEAVAVGVGLITLTCAAGVYRMRRTRLERALERLADDRCWDYRTGQAIGSIEDAPTFADGAEPHRYLSGPVGNGTFRFIEYRTREGSPDGILLTIPMPRSSPGLQVTPQQRFRVRGPARSTWESDAAFTGRFRVSSAEPAFAEQALAPAVRDLLLKPKRGVRFQWSGTTLWVWFPVVLEDPRAVMTLLRYGEALARLLAGGGVDRARRIAMPEPHPLPGDASAS